MLETIKKGFLASLGVAVVTMEKIQEATRSLVQEGKISTGEAEKLAEELVKSGEQQWREINEKFDKSMRKVAENVHVVRNKEFQELKEKLEALEQRVALLEGTREEETEPASPLG